MLDIKYIRENAEPLKKAIKNKKIKLDLDELLTIDKERLTALKAVEELNAQKNANSAEVGKASPKDRPAMMAKGKDIKEKLEKAEAEFKKIDAQYFALMVKVPTIPSADTPVGTSEDDNVEVMAWGEKPEFDFKPKSHIELAENLGIINFETGAKVAGYRGYYLVGDGAMLVLALMNYAMQKLAAKGFMPMVTPTLIKEFPLFGSGYFQGTEYNSDVDNIYQVATHEEDQTGAQSKEKKFLAGTAEPALLAYYSDQILDESQLPIRLCGFSPCYRSEIGSYGKDVKGLYRVHEFMKVEQVIISKADIEESTRLQEEMVALTEEIHRDLKLPYRKLQICTADMAPGKYRAFDLEAWMPGLKRYGETGSASNFLDWQARRLNVKYKDKDGNKKYAYLLNNTALPSVRPLIAILENYQQADGSVIIPEVLRPFMAGKTVITKK